VGSSLPSNRSATGILRDHERRLNTLSSQSVRPEVVQSRYDQLPKGIIARQADLTTTSIGYGDLASTDFTIADVEADGTRLYKVCLHTIAFASAASVWDLTLYLNGNIVTGTAAARMRSVRLEGGATNRVGGSDVVLWEPDTGTYDLLIVVGRAVGAGDIQFTGAAADRRQFWVEDFGPR
jgi:hypothetical protein